ncbi:2,4-dichlorophenol 6-monooxygenase [Nocardia sp. SYP-A9097]|uniref:FAD-dependent monooxygenase n=1 Tax=Nocardia sp. SYP-A9097 TaxID=2663237 RepID=UPI00129B5855|nr:FAD-dependent monooxygenase [Nocardia sp. SYP-A9097]MRH90562.1 2,4-dichlorophenol 6-monooxygenase [Nocardia sp. SYP-A9097]
MTDKQVPVLIAGGGSVGLATALFLADRGIESLVVEAQDGPSAHPRATGLGPRTAELLREAGLQEAVDAVCVNMTDGGLGKIYVRTLAETDFAALPLVTPLRRMWGGDDISPGRVRGLCPQHRLDSVMLPAARERGAVVRYSTRMESFAQGSNGVRVRLSDDSIVRADYLIGADGVRSGVREAVRVGVSGPGALGNPMMSMLFRADLTSYLQGRRFVTCNVDNPGVRGMLATVDGAKEWILHTECTEAVDAFSEDECRSLIRAAIGDPTIDVEIVSVLPWRPRGLVADRFQVGRVFLVGDAAHAVPPLGAFGLNTGIADGHNLAWKIAAVHSGRAGAALLDTYTAERRPVAQTTLDQAVRRLPDPQLHWGSGPEIAAARQAAGVLNAPVVQLGYRYDSAAVIDADLKLPSTEDLSLNLDGSPGSRLPHRWLDHDGHRVSTLDLVGPGFTLLTASRHWQRAAQSVAESHPAGLSVHRIIPGDWSTTAGIGDTGAILVRPDHFIAWRTPESPTSPAAAIIRALDRISAQSTR